MRIARVAAGKAIGFGVLEGDEVALLDGPPIGEIRFTGDRVPLDKCRLLAPVLPSKVVGVSGNYPYGDPAARPAPEPLIFLKPSTSVIGPSEPIRVPPGVARLEHECELGVVVSGLVRNADVDAARAAILGYTVANDVTAADIQQRESQWARAKGFDSFCPLGPWIETTVDPSALSIQGRVNGETRAKGSTAEMFRSPAELVSAVSQVMTLLPGDVVLTGTPARFGPTEPDDVVECAIEGVGVLRNPVRAAG